MDRFSSPPLAADRLAATQTDTTSNASDLATLLDKACLVAVTDFRAAATSLRSALPAEITSGIQRYIGQRWSELDTGAIACTIYLLGEARSADDGATAGWYALELGCDDDGVIIALADVVQSQSYPRRRASAVMRERLSIHRSTAFLVKLADHYRTEGHAFLAEELLRNFITKGRKDLVLRLAELWFEFHNWPSARNVLWQLTPDQVTAGSLYMLGRSCASLMLEGETLRLISELAAFPKPGPSYANLLKSIWKWRVGDHREAIASCPNEEFPPLINRDAVSLRSVLLKGETGSPVNAKRSISLNDTSRRFLPNVLGIGMQRSGTSWLWRQISRHPDVQSLGIKELAFFNDEFRSLDNYPQNIRDIELSRAEHRYWQGPTRSLRHYRNLFEKGCRLDISPSYGELPDEAVTRVRDMLGTDAKILLSVRDPVERSWSNLKIDLLATGENPMSLSFAERTALYQSVRTMRRCDYASVLRRWRRFFYNVEVIFFDDIVSQPNEVLSRLYRLIGLTACISKDSYIPVNETDATVMPLEDRLFLFGLHQPTYDQSEAELGGPALGWRRKQLELLG